MAILVFVRREGKLSLPQAPSPSSANKTPPLAVHIAGQSVYAYPQTLGGMTVFFPLDNVQSKSLEPYGLYGWSIEVVGPKGTKDCPYHIHQYIKETTQFADGRLDKLPPPQANDPGGFDSDNWAPDPPPDGRNLLMQENDDGTQSYMDSPGFVIWGGRQLPARMKARLAWILHDCSDNLVSRLEAEYHLEIDSDGRVTKRELSWER
jgi:hypothetical protein